jgi:hypothetical protein
MTVEVVAAAAPEANDDVLCSMRLSAISPDFPPVQTFLSAPLGPWSGQLIVIPPVYRSFCNPEIPQSDYIYLISTPTRRNRSSNFISRRNHSQGLPSLLPLLLPCLHACMVHFLGQATCLQATAEPRYTRLRLPTGTTHSDEQLVTILCSTDSLCSLGLQVKRSLPVHLRSGRIIRLDAETVASFPSLRAKSHVELLSELSIARDFQWDGVQSY